MSYRDSYFRLLVEHSTDAIALINRQGAVLYASPATEKILGYTVAELKKIELSDIIHPDDLPIQLAVLSDLIKTPKKTITMQFRIKHKDGRWLWVESSSTNLLSEPILKALVFNFRDITERKEIEYRKDEFISIASHELKTPLTSLKGFAQLLNGIVSKNPKQQKIYHYVTKINEQVDRLSDLVNDLLDVSKIQSGKLDLKKEWFLIDGLIIEIASDMQETTATHIIETQLDAPKKICADKYRISQVLINLVSNAIKYSPQGKRVIIFSNSAQNGVEVAVQDFGIGIAKKDLNFVFEKFYQAKNKIRTSFAGLGLGLYISAEIIKRHHGRIWVESQKGVGSTFSFTIPTR